MTKIFLCNRILLSVFLIFFLSHSYSQVTTCPASENKKAIHFFKDASDAFKLRKYDDAKTLAGKAVDEDPEFADAYLLQGKIALKKRDDKEMEMNFKKVIELCPDLDPEVYFQLGWLYFDIKKWKESEEQLNKFLGIDKINEDHAVKAESMLVKAKLYAHPVPFVPVAVKDLGRVLPPV